MTAIKVTREELYEQVWTTPMSRLATRYGISDVALAKTCRRLNIPRPGRGYWQQLAARVKVKRTPLPRTGSREEWTFLDRVENPTPKVPSPKAPDVPVANSLQGAHEVTARARLASAVPIRSEFSASFKRALPPSPARRSALVPEKEIELAPTEARDALDEYVSRVLAALGHPEALATDESLVSDFLDVTGRDHRRRPRGGGSKGPWTDVPADPEVRRENEAPLRVCQDTLRVPVSERDLIIDVARRLRALGHA